MTTHNERFLQRIEETQKQLKQIEVDKAREVEEQIHQEALLLKYRELLTTNNPTDLQIKQLKRIQRTLLGPNHVQTISVNNSNHNDNSWFGSTGGYYGD